MSPLTVIFRISPGRLQDVAMSYLGLHQYRDLHKMQRGDTHFRLLESFLKRVFVLVDMNSISRPPKNDSRKKQIIGIKSSRELDTWTFLKDGQPMTVKVRHGHFDQFLNLLELGFRFITRRYTTRI